MTEIDWIIIALLLLSTIVGIVRGVVREVLAIAGWIVGIVLAMNFAGDIAGYIPLESIGYVPRVIIAAVLIVVAVLFGCGLLGMLIGPAEMLIEWATPYLPDWLSEVRKGSRGI